MRGHGESLVPLFPPAARDRPLFSPEQQRRYRIIAPGHQSCKLPSAESRSHKFFGNQMIHRDRLPNEIAATFETTPRKERFVVLAPLMTKSVLPKLVNRLSPFHPLTLLLSLHSQLPPSSSSPFTCEGVGKGHARAGTNLVFPAGGQCM